jgi:hypothetical protein
MSTWTPTNWPQNTTQVGAAGQPSFQARRPFSSNELLALRKKAIVQALNAPPINTVNLQDSSEFTARVRKLASRDLDPIMEIARTGIQLREPNPVMRGGGTIVNNTSANMIARAAGNAYAADFFNHQTQLEVASQGCATLLNDNVTFPKKIVCAPPQRRPAYHVVQPFSNRIRFGRKRNTNKVVIAAHTGTLANAAGQCGLTTLYPTL